MCTRSANDSGRTEWTVQQRLAAYIERATIVCVDNGATLRVGVKRSHCTGAVHKQVDGRHAKGQRDASITGSLGAHSGLDEAAAGSARRRVESCDRITTRGEHGACRNARGQRRQWR